MRRLLTVVVGVALLVLSAGGPATAEPPFAVTERVTDRAGAMSRDNVPPVVNAIAELESEDQVRLFIVYVDSFDGILAGDWAADTAVQSGLVANHFLFAVAFVDGYWGWTLDPSLGLSNAEIDKLTAQEVIPQLRAGNTDVAAINLAEALRERISREREPGSEGDAGSEEISGVGIIGGLVVIVAGLAAGAGAAYLISRHHWQLPSPIRKFKPPDRDAGEA